MLPCPTVAVLSPLALDLRTTPGSVLYFSVDDCRRPDVLRSAGLTVHECASLSELAAFLNNGENPDLVCVGDQWNKPAESALSIVRSVTVAPLILFSCGTHAYPDGACDLEVPALTHPGIWLPRVVEMLEHRTSP